MTAVTFFRPVAAPRMDGALALLAFARPFLLLAALAFFAGFGGYLIFGPPQVMGPLQAHPAPAAAVGKSHVRYDDRSRTDERGNEYVEGIWPQAPIVDECKCKKCYEAKPHAEYEMIEYHR